MSKTKDKPVISPFRKIVRKEAQKEEKNNIAINMLKKGSDMKFISEVTSLTISEVEELKNNLKLPH